nr:hypothetical protein [Bacilli bacterium]
MQDTSTKTQNLLSYVFCKTFFEAMRVTFLQSATNTLCILLPEEMDKALIHRPFYWLWKETMGEIHKPTCWLLYFEAGVDEMNLLQETAHHDPSTISSYFCGPFSKIYANILQLAKQKANFIFLQEQGRSDYPYSVFVLKIAWVTALNQEEIATYAYDHRKKTVILIKMETIFSRYYAVSQNKLPSSLLSTEFSEQCFQMSKNAIQKYVESIYSERYRVAFEKMHALFTQEIQPLQDYFEVEMEKRKKKGRDSDDLIAEKALRMAEWHALYHPTITIEILQIAFIKLSTPLRDNN